MKKLVVLFLTLFVFNALAENTNVYFCKQEFSKLPILQGGRVKPLYVHSKEMMKYLTGKTELEGLSSTLAYCLLSLEGLGISNSLNINIRVDHSESRALLELGEEKTIKVTELVDKKDLIRAQMSKATPDSSYQKSLKKLLNKVSLYSNIVSSQNWLLPELNNNEISWVPLSAFLRESKILEAKKTSINPFQVVIQESANHFDKVNPKSSYKLEYKYAKANLPIWSMLISLVGLLFLTLFKKFKVALGLGLITVVIQAIHIAMRVMISGRAPITNMYETVMFSGFGALILAIIIGHYKKEKVFIYIGLAYNVCTLMMMNFAGSMLSPNISPLVPVLRDNFWLSTHVTTIILSYGALALSWVLGNSVLIKGRFNSLSSADEKYYSDLIYTCLKYGTIMLGAGIVLGGIWADYSWGRFWGWDPKETWSLIVLCIYIAILHGRYTNWIPPKRFIPLVTASFMSVMMAWFGVNYILAAGLHSYGFSEGGAIFLGSFFLIQILVLVFTWKPVKNNREPKNV